MRALGDSNFTHKKYATQIVDEVLKDSTMDRFFEPNHLAYHDSLRKNLVAQKIVFESQWAKNKPLVGQWEKMDMDFDRHVQAMKSGDISEKEGLDSLISLEKQMKATINWSDSMTRDASRNYWNFRNTHAEYQYNLKNLMVLYSKKLYP